MKPNSNTIAAAILFHVRNSKNLSTTEMAEKMGMSQSAYSRLETGAAIQFETLVRFSQETGVTMHQLISYHETAFMYVRDSVKEEVDLKQLRKIVGVAISLASP